MKEDVMAVPTEQQLDGTRLEIGACRYCGQTYQMEVSGPWTEEMLDGAATEKCDCLDATEEKRKKKMLNKCFAKIDLMFPDKEECFINLLKQICLNICDENIGKASLDVDERTKVGISMTTKGNIKIQAVEKTTKVSEVD